MIVNVERCDWGFPSFLDYDDIVVTLDDGWCYLYDTQEGRWAKRCSESLGWHPASEAVVPDAVKLAVRLEAAT